MTNNIQTMNLVDLGDRHPNVAECLREWGIENIVNSPQFAILGKNVSLEQVADMKGLDLGVISARIEALLESKALHPAVKIAGLLPCPVRLPLLDAFDNYVKEYGVDVETDLKAASLGTEGLADLIHSAEVPDDLPDILISAGFDLFFDSDFQQKWLDSGVFRYKPSFPAFNSEFVDKGLPDPNGKYGMISLVPAVFMVNKEVLGDLDSPKSWEELLSGRYRGMVSLPIQDFDLFNAILIHLENRFGEKGIQALRDCLFDAMHPAQMVKSADKRRDARPAITVLPWFFTRTVREGSPLQPVWPEEGAIVSPIFILVKDSGNPDVKRCADFLCSQSIGEILAHKGLFPSAHPDVDNHLPEGKSFWWVGWEHLRGQNIQQLIKTYAGLFETQGEMEV